MFEAVVDFPDRALPAIWLAIAGLVLTVRGTRLGWDWARHQDPRHNLRFVRGFRLAVVGLTLLAVAAAWQ